MKNNDQIHYLIKAIPESAVSVFSIYSKPLVTNDLRGLQYVALIGRLEHIQNLCQMAINEINEPTSTWVAETK